MPIVTKGTRAFALWLGFPLLICLSSSAWGATKFVISGPGAGLYQVNAGFYSFAVTAFTGASPDTFYNNVVTVGLFDTATTQVSDPGVTIVSSAVSYIGSAPLTFNKGALSFQMKFMSGADSEQVFLQDSGGTPVTTGDTYPGTFGSVGGAAITVQGFSTLYYMANSGWATQGSTPASYTSGSTNYDPIFDQGSTVIGQLDNQGGDVSTLIPAASGAPDTFTTIPPSAAAFAVTGVNGGYAAGGQIILGNGFFQRTNGLTSGPVTYAVILDYDGSLTDFNHPRPNQDTVYLFRTANTTVGPTNFTLVNSGGPVANSAPFQPFMSNGQVIVRAWSTSATNPENMRYETYTGSPLNLSRVSVPYSQSNTQPVRGVASPTLFLTGGPATLIYTLTNRFSSPVSQVSFQFPANSPVAGNPWVFSSGSGPSATVNIASNPSTVASTPGTIFVDFSTPLGVNQTAAITLLGTASNQDGSYPVSMVSAINAANGQPAPTDPNVSTIKTLSPPSAPASFGGSVTAYVNTGGSNVDLGWSQVTNESSLGYVLTRAPGGLPFSNVTLPDGTLLSNAMTFTPNTKISYTDPSVTNLTSYTYTLRTFNTVSHSSSVNFGPIVPYVNPGLATAVTALTGGTNIQVTWAAPVSVPGSYPVSGYQVFMGPSGGETLLGTVLGSAATSFTNGSLATSGTTYFYEVAAFDTQYPPSVGAPLSPHIGGLTSETSQASGEPPGNPPTGLTAVLTPGATPVIHTSWAAPNPNQMLNGPATAYQLQIQPDGSGGGFVTIAAPTLSYDDSAVTIGHFYVYTVKAFDGNGVLSNPNGPVSGYVGPSAPTTLNQFGGASNVTLYWPAVANSAGETITSYNLYQNGTLVGTPVPAVSGTVTAVDATSLVQGINYTYQVSAVDQNSVEGGKSIAVTTALLPLVSQNFAATVQQTGVSFNVDLTWNAPVSSANVTSYNIRINNTNSFPGTFVGGYALAPQPVTNVQPTSAAGTTLFYWIRGVDPGGPGAYPVVGLQLPPNPPTGVGSSSTPVSITVNWSANPAPENVSLYSIYRSTNPSSGFVTIGTTAGTSFSDGTGLIAGTDYYYKVSATNPGGGVGVPGGESLLSAAITSALSPSVPIGLASVLNPASDNVTLTWTSQASSEANLATYTLSRTINGGAPTTLQTAAASVTNFTDTGITSANAGATVLYYLFASNDAGAKSAQEGPVGLQVPPNPPTGTGSSSTATTITVNWTARPASENVNQYTIYRTLLPAGTPVAVGTATPGTATSFNDGTGLSRGATYVYNITATNPGGGVGVPGGEGLLSANVTTGLAPLTPTGLAISGINNSNFVTLGWIPVTGSDPNSTAVSLLVNANSAVTTGAVATSISPVSSGGVSDPGFFNGAVTGTSPDTTYYYWLQTKNPFGVSALDGPVSQLTYPGAVNLMPVTLAPDGVSRILNWTALPADVTQYLVYRELSGSGNWVKTHTLAGSGLTLPVTLTSAIQPGKSYDYKIVAVNPTGNGPDSNIQSFSTLPSAPVSVTAVSGISNAVTQVDLSWADPTAASESVTGFTIYRATNNGSVTNYTAAATLTSLTYVYSDSSVAVTGTGVYYYIVAADDNLGLETFLSTVNAVAVTAFAQPNPPTAPSANAVNGSVTLSWTAASATTYPVSIYQINKTANGVTLSPLTSATSPFADTSVTNGVTYVYTVQTVDNQGNLSALAGPVTGVPLNAPGPPLNPSAVTGDTQLLLTWNPATPGTLPIGGYQIFNITAGPTTTLLTTAPATVNSFLVTGLSNGVTYTYLMNTIDNSGFTTGLHVSSNTATFSGTPQNAVVNPPSNLAAQAGIAQVLLSWTDSVTVSAPVTGYAVYQSTNGLVGPFSAVVTVAANGSANQSITQTSLTNGTTYSYYLVAQASSAVAQNSATVTGIPAAPPAAPASLTGTDGNNQAVLNWTAVLPQGSISINGYYIVQSINAGAPSTLLTAGPVTTYTDNSVSNGQTVVYQVGAINSNNTQGALAGPVTDYPYAAFAPAITGHTSSTSAVTLTFNPAGSPSWPVTQFDFLRTTVSSGASTLIPAGTSSPVSDTSAVLGTLYGYQLVALDNKGHMSTASNAVTDGASNSPAAPATILLVPGSQQVLIDWPASAPVSGSLPVSFYILDVNGTPVTIPAAQTWYLDSGLTDPAPVTVSITVVDASGQFTANHSVTLNAAAPVTTASTDINPPTGLTATSLGTTSVKLTWTAPNDEGYPVTAFNVYRAASFQSAAGSLVTTVASPPSAFGPVTTFTDTGLSPNTTYYYVVQALYAQTPAGPAGNSPDSNNATATTGAAAAGVPPVTLGTMAFDANVLLPNTGQTLGIYFIAPNSGPTELDVYNISGNPVRALYATAVSGAQVNLTWDGKDRNGKTVASGLYLIEIKGPGIHLIRKVIVVK
jgi:fibronectin type 3 domain-containing protein